MGKVKGKHRLDKYYRLAKEHGYRSRAAWKLVQLDAKHSILRSANSVLDLCAAPGGWMQVAVERVPVGSLVIGIDLDPIRPIRGAISVQEDITSSKCKATVTKLMAENGCRAFDLVLHDGSPNVGGAWAKEATSQNALVVDSLKLAADLLVPKGTFVTKVFRSQDYSAVFYCLKQLFDKVEVYKPQASREASAEIYVIGLKYKAPAKIDPRLLDVKHLFQGGKEPTKVIDVLRGTKQKRHREGYEDGVSILRKVSSAADFVWSDAPLDVLGSVTTISFEDPDSLPLKDHNLTTEEVRALCDDLRVLGKQDFKNLLKWRTQLRKALSSTEKVPSTTPSEHEVKDENDMVLDEMEELTHAIERKKKRNKRLLAKRRAKGVTEMQKNILEAIECSDLHRVENDFMKKDKERKALGIQVDVTLDGYMDQELFSLTSIKGKKDLVAVDNNEYNDEAGDIGSSEDERSHEGAQDYSSSDIDSEEERKRYDEQMEELLDEAYEQYVARKEGSTRQRKRAKQTRENQLLDGSNDNDIIHGDEDSDNDQEDQAVNPLVVPLLEDMPTQEEIAAKWFSQDVFAEPDEEQLEQFDSEDDMQVDGPTDHPKKIMKDAPEEQVMRPKENNNTLKTLPKSQSKANEDFEVVPAPLTDSSDSSSSDESDEDEIETRAQILAYARKMLSKKQREEILDDAYNKYMFHDDAGLPKWFLDEEKRHRQPMKPVTKEEVAAMRAQFKEIDARPAKKVAEAKARKKRAAQKKLEKIRKKANTISDQVDISDRSKRKMIEQLYKKAAPKKPEKEYVVAKKGVQVRAGKGKVLVDRRMKKDARSRGKGPQGKGKKGKNKGKVSKAQTKKNKANK